MYASGVTQPALIHAAMNRLCQRHKTKRISRASWVFVGTDNKRKKTESGQQHKKRKHTPSPIPQHQASAPSSPSSAKTTFQSKPLEESNPHTSQMTPLMYLTATAKSLHTKIAFNVVAEEGPLHSRIFVMKLIFRDTEFLTRASSKQKGKQLLAELALEHFGMQVPSSSASFR
jgi:hypothetical protein